MKFYFFSFFSLLLVWSCDISKSKKEENRATPTKVVSQGVSVNAQILVSTIFQRQIISNGNVEASQKSELHFKTNEYLVKINVINGQKVYQGQVLAQLDNAVILNQLNKAKIDLDKAETKLQEEKINYGLDGQQDSNINNTVLRNLHIKSGYTEAKNALKNAQILYEQTFLKSPINGVVANIKTKAGNLITTSDVFCTVVNQTNMEVVFSVQENDLIVVQVNQEVSISPFSDVNKSYKGKVSEINPMVDENGLIQIKAKVNDSDNALFDGMNAKVIINQPMENVIVVPKEALVLRSNREVVFTVENGLAKWNYVKVSDENSTSYALENGLKLGDTIIVSGNINLAHDAKVTPTFILEDNNN